MFFQIRSVILWPRDDHPPQVVQFELGVVNVISGASKTGKSAMIPIIDFCLGADKCAIPVGHIREKCGWFGILVETVEGQKLLARREPGSQKNTGDMVLLEGSEIEIPEKIENKTHTAGDVKAMLNRLSGLPALGFDPESTSGFKGRPSFRDLVAFNFQPQNVVANPDVLFFKADTTEHREKLKTIFPYVLGAITPGLLEIRFELDRLQKLLRRKEAEQRTLQNANDAWRAEADTWVRRAIDLNLLAPSQQPSVDWQETLGILRSVVKNYDRRATPTVKGIESVLDRLQALRASEAEAAGRLTEHRQRLQELRRLQESTVSFRDSVRVQRDRLSIADWLRDQREATVVDPIATMTDADGQQLQVLCDALATVEVQLRTQPGLSETLEKETLRQRSLAEEVIANLVLIRKQIAALEQTSKEVAAATERFERVERFVGRLEQALATLDRVGDSSDLGQEINALKEQVRALQAKVSESEIRRKVGLALARIQNATARMIPQLDAEWPDAPIQLVIEDLTVKVLRADREDYLWEIGSGANWLAYHVAMTLALQEVFLSDPISGVPGLLVYDQPSQVYFPKRNTNSKNDEEEEEGKSWRNEDIEAVRKVFALLAAEVLSANGRLQVIVFDHADEEVWGNLAGVHFVGEWRNGKKLVPLSW
ncbi:MAG: DUF3732 domain-containing protein [Gammaproteobacteria bacterium]|nr:DUF3732 domain-containing protein [Gammaproteobacteria bacterium]